MLITNATLITWDSPNQILEDYVQNDRLPWRILFGFQQSMVTTIQTEEKFE